MNNIKSVVLCVLLGVALASTCTTPSTIIKSKDISSVFSRAISLINYKPQLIELISLPSIDNVKSYLMTQAPYVIPFFCIGGLTFVMLFGCCIQLCCYNCCGQKKCGTPISVKSFKPCSVSCCVYTFMIFSLLLMGASVASFVVSSDLLKETNYSICNFNSTLVDLFQGTNTGTNLWSGVANFNTFALEISTNFPNSIPTLNQLFTSPEFTATVNTASSSLFSQAIAAYSCPIGFASNIVSCPFSDLSQCVNANNQQIPIFSKQFCNASFNNSAAWLVAQEQQQNSTLWQSSLFSLSAVIDHFNNNPVNFSELISQSSQLQSAISTYQPQMESGVQLAYDNMHTAQMGLYGVLGLFLLMGFISFLSICCVYCTRNFKCRYLLYILWLFFAVLTIVFFIISGVLLMGTFVAYDTCSLYHQISSSQSLFNSFPFPNSSETMKILDTCFFPPSNSSNISIFQSFGQQQTFQQIQNLETLYFSANPSPTFNSASSHIINQLTNYSTNPNYVTLDGATTTQNPQAALASANAYASNGGSSSCQAVNDTLVYNSNDCYPLLLNQPAGSPSCILIEDSSSTIITDREPSFIDRGCSSNFGAYQSNFNALNTFGNDISSLTQNYISDSGLTTYTANYFNYYQAVTNFMNSYTQSLFLSFISPYQSLVQGSSCSYLTSTLQNLVDNTCNNNFPYVYALTVLVILISCFFFFLMIFAYFLTVRMEFYQYLNGDLSNYEQGAAVDQKNEQIEMADLSSTNRQKLLPAPSVQYQEPSSPERYAPMPPPHYPYPPYQGNYAQYPPPPPTYVQQPPTKKTK